MAKVEIVICYEIIGCDDISEIARVRALGQRL